MFTDKLYDHKFDIDDIIRAFCGDDHDGRWLLCSRDGELIPETPNHPSTKTIKDGDDNNHWHVIEPLPASFLTGLKKHEMLNKLSDEDQNAVLTFLEGNTKMFTCIHFFNQDRAGGWLRERIKEACMEWLNVRKMIPPSMEHVNADALFGAPPDPEQLKIKIKLD